MISEEIQRMGGTERATQFNADLEQAIRENGNRWGSNKDFVAEQIEQARKNPGLFYFGVSDTGRRIAWIPPVGKQSVTVTPRMNIPVECWRPIGEKDLFNRLLAQVEVNGQGFHAEAFEVRYDEEGVMHILEDGYENLQLVIAPDACMQSMPIDLGPQAGQAAARQYVIIISPNCE